MVVFDRYPLPGLTLDGHLMDGPRIRAVLGDGNRVLAWLAAREEQLYRRIAMPDQVVVMHLPADVALARKTHRDPDAVRAKAAAVEQFELANTPVAHVDASQPADAVLRAVKAVLWGNM